MHRMKENGHARGNIRAKFIPVHLFEVIILDPKFFRAKCQSP